MGRMRPKLLIGNGLRGVNWEAGGAFGAFARIAGSDVTTVKSVVPSKFRESRTIFRYASSVTSATEARTTDLQGFPNRVCMNPELKFGLHASPSRGCQLLWSEPQAGMIPFFWKQPLPLGSGIVPPLNAPTSMSQR